ncbi:MAG: UDP-N-acetylmuramate dehydrogenase [Balneolales bacterium]
MKSTLQKQVSLKPFNTFQIDATAEYLAEISHPDDLTSIMASSPFNRHPHYVLGGGSNVLFVDDFPGLIIKNNIPGITVVAENTQYVIIRVGAGVVWDELVKHTLNHGWGGLENLSMIPGLTGAAPIQNIGAYGVELEKLFVSLDAIHLKTGKTESFDRSMCKFGYRDSIFKSSLKGKYLITYVTLKLGKKPAINVEYGNLKKVLKSEGIKNPTIRDVSRAVRRIRKSKLPDPLITGNAGSFFKNPVLSGTTYEILKMKHPQMPGYFLDSSGPHSFESGNTTSEQPVAESDGRGRVKVPAAWLIEQCGFKGMREGDTGVHEKHALILVNHGAATGTQLLKLARTIQEEVLDHFEISLEPEVHIVSNL